MNQYLVELIHTDSRHNEELPDKIELLRIVRDGHNLSKDILVYNYVILKLGAAILSYFYTSGPSDKVWRTPSSSSTESWKKLESNLSRLSEKIIAKICISLVILVKFGSVLC